MPVTRSVGATLSVASGIISGEGVVQIDAQMKPLQGEVAPLVNYFGYGPALKVNEDWTFKWTKDEDMPIFVTLIAGMDNSQTTITAGTELSANDVALLQVGSVVHIVSAAGDEQVYVTANDGTTVTITRGYLSTSGAAHLTGDIAYILLPAYVDTASFPESPRSVGEFATTYFQQAMFELTETDYKTMQANYLTGQQDPLAYHKMKLREWALKLLNNSIIYNLPSAPTGSVPGSFAGLDSLITTNVRAVTGNLGPSDFVDVIELLEQKDPNLSGLTIMGNRNSKRILDGITASLRPRQYTSNQTTANFNMVSSIETNQGTFPWMTVPQIKDGTIYLVRKEDVKLHPGNVTGGMGTGWVELTRDAADYNARKRAAAISWIGSLILRNEKRHGKITFTGATLGGYADVI